MILSVLSPLYTGNFVAYLPTSRNFRSRPPLTPLRRPGMARQGLPIHTENKTQQWSLSLQMEDFYQSNQGKTKGLENE